MKLWKELGKRFENRRQTWKEKEGLEIAEKILVSGP